MKDSRVKIDSRRLRIHVLLNVLEHVCRLLGDGVSCLKPGETLDTAGTGYVLGQPVEGDNADSCNPAGSTVTDNRGGCFVIGGVGFPLRDEIECWESDRPPPGANQIQPMYIRWEDRKRVHDRFREAGQELYDHHHT